MANVRFVFDGGAELLVRAASDRSAKLMVTGMRRRLDEEGSIVEVKGENGSQFINADRLCFVEFQMSERRSGGAKKAKAKKAPAPAKKAKRRR